MKTLHMFEILVLAAALVASVGCSKRQLTPARVIPPGDENTRLCKETYQQCRGQCFNTEQKKIMEACSNQCERDVDTCLLQSSATK